MFYFGGFVCFDYVLGDKLVFVCYMLNELMIYRIKFENVDVLYEKYVGELFILFGKDYLDEFLEFMVYMFMIKEGKMDIVFFGFGWVMVQNVDKKIMVYVLKGVYVFVC